MQPASLCPAHASSDRGEPLPECSLDARRPARNRCGLLLQGLLLQGLLLHGLCTQNRSTPSPTFASTSASQHGETVNPGGKDRDRRDSGWCEVFDGSGRRPFRTDIGIRDGRIACIGDLSEIQPDRAHRVERTRRMPRIRRSAYALRLHVVVTGGRRVRCIRASPPRRSDSVVTGCAPVARRGDARHGAIGYSDDCAVDMGWQSFGDYLERLDSNGLGVNVAAFVGHGAIHRAVMGDELRAPSIDETERMAELLAEAFDQGAYGFSTGLEYWPGNICAPEHIIPLCEVAGRRDRLYATHVRNRDVHYDLGFGEALCTARNASARLQISHIQPKYGAPPHAMEHSLEMIESVRRQGVDVAFDVIPHDWAHTLIKAILPPWAQEGGAPAILERLKDPDTRERMKRNPKHMWRVVTDERWDRIALLNSEENPQLVGETFADIGRMRNTSPFDAALDLIEEEGDRMGSLLWTSHSFDDDDIDLCLRQPECVVISDTLALAPYGALANILGVGIRVWLGGPLPGAVHSRPSGPVARRRHPPHDLVAGAASGTARSWTVAARTRSRCHGVRQGDRSEPMYDQGASDVCGRDRPRAGERSVRDARRRANGGGQRLRAASLKHRSIRLLRRARAFPAVEPLAGDVDADPVGVRHRGAARHPDGGRRGASPPGALQPRGHDVLVAGLCHPGVLAGHDPSARVRAAHTALPRVRTAIGARAARNARQDPGRAEPPGAADVHAGHPLPRELQPPGPGVHARRARRGLHPDREDEGAFGIRHMERWTRESRRSPDS